MSCSKEYLQLLHKYIDHDLSNNDEENVKKHLRQCEDCKQHLLELERVVSIVKNSSAIAAPDYFTSSVMEKLTNPKRTSSWKSWLKGHPLLAAAAVFILLMTGGLLSAWSEDRQFSVSEQPNLVIENDVVTVPQGEVVEGDVTVKNGTLMINGTVEGDVVVINGEKYLASAGHVTGEIEEVDQLFEWLWFHMKTLSYDVVAVFN